MGCWQFTSLGAMKVTFLGTGTSVGIPMIGCDCATCHSRDSRDKRLRTGLLVENGEQRLVVDLSTDFRQQALRAGITRLDAVLITHCHADHVFGLDDLRPLNFRHGPIDVFASDGTWQELKRVFYYIFAARHIGGGLPQVNPQIISGEFSACGLRIQPLPVIHGKSEVTAYRFTDGNRSFAFVTDCNSIPATSLAMLHDLDLLILDALRLKPHPTHLHLAQSLAYVQQLRPRRTLLTHMGHDIRHAEVSRHLPDGVELAYDELQIEV